MATKEQVDEILAKTKELRDLIVSADLVGYVNVMVNEEFSFGPPLINEYLDVPDCPWHSSDCYMGDEPSWNASNC